MLFLWMRCKITLLRQTLWCRARLDPGSKSMSNHLLKPDFPIAPGQRAFIFFPTVFNCYSKNPYVDNRLLGLGHVWDDAICDDEEHKVLGAILHWSRIPTHKNIFVVISVSAALFRLLRWFITRASFWVVLNCLAHSQIKYTKIAVWKRTKGVWWKEHESEKRSKMYGKVTLQAKWK